MSTEIQEHRETSKALDEITGWARALAAGQSPDGGENISFSIAREGATLILDSFLSGGDCTPFSPSGKRGVLHNQPSLPLMALFINPSNGVNQVPYSLTVDLNKGTVTLNGSFPNLSSTMEFHLEFLKRFEGGGGKCILFNSDKSSDDAGYLITFNLVGA